MPPVVPIIATPEDIGRLIRTRRKALRMTQERLAMQSGVVPQTISAIENGKSSAQIGIVLQLCRDLGIRLGEVG